MADAEQAPVLSVEDVHKTFHIGFFRKRVDAVRGISFEVERGTVFGLLGPNGAGKTTTIKMMLRLIFPSAGSIRIFGRETDPDVMARIGYMPENPYVYQYLTPLEFLDLCARLMGISRTERRTRAEKMVELVGLTDAVDRPIGKFSKGMMQRIGLAQALLHEPELLILDEPMSGLDPIGRKQIRDVLLAQRDMGRTLIFTSHILSDVEMLCDRVVILNRGKITARGALDELLHAESQRTDVELSGVDAPTREKLEALATSIRQGEAPEAGEADERVVVVVEGRSAVAEVLQAALAGGATVDGVIPHRERLEDLFVRDAMEGGQAAAKSAGKSE